MQNIANYIRVYETSNRKTAIDKLEADFENFQNKFKKFDNFFSNTVNMKNEILTKISQNITNWKSDYIVKKNNWNNLVTYPKWRDWQLIQG